MRAASLSALLAAVLCVAAACAGPRTERQSTTISASEASGGAEPAHAPEVDAGVAAAPDAGALPLPLPDAGGPVPL